MAIKFNNTMSFHLTSEQAAKLTALSVSRPNKTETELVSQAIEMGIYQLLYRGKMNKKNAELKKLGRRTLEALNSGKNLEAMRAFGKSVGLIVETDDSVIEHDDDTISLEDIDDEQI